MSRPHVVAPFELSSLRDLELMVRSTVEGLRQGLHRSPFHGYSAEFSQYRHYRPGDDLKYVDWKAFGRTDRFYTRQFRETTNLAALFVVDVSRSMDYPHSGSKFALARAAAATLGALVIDQGDTAGLLAVGERTSYLPPRSGRHHFHLFLATLAQLQASSAEAIDVALGRAATIVRRRGLFVVLSDFYDEDPALAAVRRLARMGHDVIIVHVLAREELGLEHVSAGEFRDLETGKTLVVEPALVRSHYRAAIRSFLTRVSQAVEREGLDYLRVVTGEPLDAALRRFLVSRRSRARA